MDVWTITTQLLQDKVFIRNPGWKNYSCGGNIMITSSIDLFRLGYTNVLGGEYIEAYKEKMRQNKEDEVQEQEEEVLEPYEHEY